MEDHESIGFLRNEFRRSLGRSKSDLIGRVGASLEQREDVSQEALLILIKKLAETYSQTAIAKILNEKGLYRENGLPWKQFAICRYFQKHGIKAIHKWKKGL